MPRLEPHPPVAILPTKGSRSIMATHIANASSGQALGAGTCCSSTSNRGCMPVLGGGPSSGGNVVLAQPCVVHHSMRATTASVCLHCPQDQEPVCVSAVCQALAAGRPGLLTDVNGPSLPGKVQKERECVSDHPFLLPSARKTDEAPTPVLLRRTAQGSPAAGRLPQGWQTSQTAGRRQHHSGTVWQQACPPCSGLQQGTGLGTVPWPAQTLSVPGGPQPHQPAALHHLPCPAHCTQGAPFAGDTGGGGVSRRAQWQLLQLRHAVRRLTWQAAAANGVA